MEYTNFLFWVVQIEMASGRQHPLGLDQMRVSRVSVNLVHKEQFYKGWCKSTNFLKVKCRKGGYRKAEGKRRAVCQELIVFTYGR